MLGRQHGRVKLTRFASLRAGENPEDFSPVHVGVRIARGGRLAVKFLQAIKEVGELHRSAILAGRRLYRGMRGIEGMRQGCRDIPQPRTNLTANEIRRRPIFTSYWPLPDSGTPAVPSLLLSCKIAVRAPLAAGLNLTSIWQLSPAASDAGQLFVNLKSPARDWGAHKQQHRQLSQYGTVLCPPV